MLFCLSQTTSAVSKMSEVGRKEQFVFQEAKTGSGKGYPEHLEQPE